MTKTTKTILGIVIVIVLVGGIWYAASRKPIEPTLEIKEAIKIGAVLPLSGKAASWGERTQRGIELALAEVNRDGEVIEIIYEDCKGEPAEAVSAAQKLINIDKVQVLVVQLSGVSQAVAPITQEAKAVLFGFTSTPGFTEQGDYIFSNRGDSRDMGKALGDFAAKQGYKKAAIIHINNETHKGGVETFKEVFERNGGEVVFLEPHEKDESDFRTMLLKIKAGEPDVLLFSSRDKNVAMMLVQARALGLTQQVLSNQGIDTKAFLEIAGDAAEGIIYAQTIVYEDTPNPELQAALKKHQEQYGEPMSLYAANAYDVVKLLGKLIKEGAKTSLEIKNALMEIKGFPGVSGDITFDETGNVRKENKLFIIKNGKFVAYED